LPLSAMMPLSPPDRQLRFRYFLSSSSAIADHAWKARSQAFRYLFSMMPSMSVRCHIRAHALFSSFSFTPFAADAALIAADFRWPCHRTHDNRP